MFYFLSFYSPFLRSFRRFLAFIKVVFELSAIALLCYGIYREKDLVKFERKVFKYVKAFVLSCVYSVKDLFVKKTEANNVVTVDVAAYEDMLHSLNKASNVYDIKIAS